MTYNVLNDWLDPDGDDLSLVTATATTEDDVRFKPDGDVTFTSKTGQAGSKEIRVTVSDGRKSATGSLIVTVKPAGTLDPVAVPDFASGFTGRPLVVHPLDNDQTPSGEPLTLVCATLQGSGARVTADQARGTITLTTSAAGEYYAAYTLGAGPKTTTGIVRFDGSLGGLGGCPYAPGASGNICSEDAIHMLDAMAHDTGIDVARLLATARELPRIVGHEVPGQLAKAGLITDLHPAPPSVAELRKAFA